MGQKVNSNSFNLERKNKINFFNSIDSSNNYSHILKETVFLQLLLKTFFERHSFLVKECFIVFSSVSLKFYIYVSFLPFMLFEKKKKLNNSEVKHLDFICLFNSFLNEYHLKLYKKVYIFKNLNLNSKKFNLNFKYDKIFRFYKRELFFILGKKLIILLQKTQGSEILFLKVIGHFLRLYYRQRKILNRFFHFLNLLFLFLYKFKIIAGIRLQIKGRLRGTPRSKKYLFQQGQLPTQTVVIPIKYTYSTLCTRYGSVGLKLWIYQ